VSFRNDQERLNTQMKLSRLAERHAALSSATGGDEELREMTIESLKRTVNQSREEIALYDAQHRMAGGATHA
jgi:hypothetical protein